MALYGNEHSRADRLRAAAHAAGELGPSAARRRLGSALRGLAALVVAVGLALGPGGAAAGFYTAEVPVDDRSAEERERAVADGLERVLGRMVGAYDGLDGHPAEALLDRAEAFLEGFRHVQREDGLALELRFDGDALRSALREAEIAVWDARRAPLLTWLAVEADGRRTLLQPGEAGDRAELLGRLREGAEARGLALRFPALDLEDRRALGFVDIWGGFDREIREASARYRGSTVLALGLRRGGDGWRARWTVLFGDELWEGQSGPGSAEAVIAEGLDRIGRTLTERFAAVPGAHEGDYLDLVLEGVDGVEDYLGVRRYLAALDGVERVRVQGEREGRLALRLEVARDPEQVGAELAGSDRLWPASPGGDAVAPEAEQPGQIFRWGG